MQKEGIHALAGNLSQPLLKLLAILSSEGEARQNVIVSDEITRVDTGTLSARHAFSPPGSS